MGKKKVLLWVEKGKLHGQATTNVGKLRKLLGLNICNSSVIQLRKGKR